MKKIVIIFVAIMLSAAMISCDNGPGEDTSERTMPIVPTMESTDLPDPESTPETEPVYEPESETKGNALVELPRDNF